MTKPKAFAYLRVSGEAQVEGDGFPRQAGNIKAYAKANGIVIAATFEEKAVSGTVDNEDRPAWAEMSARMHSDGIKTVIIEKLDRFARDLLVQERAIAGLRKCGFELVSTLEPDLMSNEPQRKFLRQMFGAMSELDKSNIVAKLRGARLRMRAKGLKCEGRKLFGDKPGEETVLQHMLALRSEGLGFDRIAAQLNAEGLPTRTGKPWHGIVVNRIISRS